MKLRPSEIFYSQDSIMNRFGDYTSHGNTYIGETLDQLLRGHCNVNSIPTISVVKKYGKWYTSDNRRLWVFRKAEELGFLETIDVNETYYLNENKFTTENGGESIRVRGRTPGGSLWISWKPKRPISSCQRSISTSYNLNTSNALYSQRNTSPSYPVSNPTTNHYHQNTSLSNRSSMSSVYSGRSEQRKTYQPPSLPTVPSPTHANTNRVSSPTIINRSTYRNDSSNVDNRQYYTNSTNTRKPIARISHMDVVDLVTKIGLQIVFLQGRLVDNNLDMIQITNNLSKLNVTSIKVVVQFYKISKTCLLQ